MTRQDFTLFGLAIGPSFAFVLFVLATGVRGKFHVPLLIVPFVVVVLPIVTVAIGLEFRRRRDARASEARPKTPEREA